VKLGEAKKQFSWEGDRTFPRGLQAQSIYRKACSVQIEKEKRILERAPRSRLEVGKAEEKKRKSNGRRGGKKFRLGRKKRLDGKGPLVKRIKAGKKAADRRNSRKDFRELKGGGCRKHKTVGNCHQEQEGGKDFHFTRGCRSMGKPLQEKCT